MVAVPRAAAGEPPPPLISRIAVPRHARLRAVNRPTRLITSCFVATVAAAALTACGGGSGEPEADTADGDLNVLVANYDLSQERPQRFLVGLVTDDQQLVSFGKVSLEFGYLGKGDPSKAEPEPGPRTTASWAPIPGQNLKSIPSMPRVVDGSDGTGVYIAPNVRFDKAGYWQVIAEVEVDGETKRGEAAFGVNTAASIVDIGDRAPATKNPLPGEVGYPVKAIDSRATPDGEVPDPELHQLTVADALGNGRPTVVVVSTPVYCVSRFCGPVTDLASKLAATQPNVNFIHIEVWRDFEKKVINKAAAEWMYPDGTEDAFEPWVWLVGADGLVTRRWDNVTTEKELTAAVAAAS